MSGLCVTARADRLDFAIVSRTYAVERTPLRLSFLVNLFAVLSFVGSDGPAKCVICHRVSALSHEKVHQVIAENFGWESTAVDGQT